MARVRPTRICAAEGCGATIGTQGTTGLCRPCATAKRFADPAYVKRLRGGLARYYEQPGRREEHGARLAEGAARWRSTMSREERTRLRDHGRWLYRTHASRPEVRARSHEPDARARAIAGYLKARLGWCPDDRRAEYADLILRKKIPAAEARRMIESELVGTAEHGRREIASRELAMRLRRERDLRDAY